MSTQHRSMTIQSSNPSVTVYITNHNYADFLQESIESVLTQNYQDFELIIIDDGSTDDSREIIQKYTDHEKTRIIFQENKGLNHSINVALNASRGEYIMRLDADDFLDPNALLVMANELDKDDSLALVFPDYYYVNKEGNVIGQERRNDFQDEVTLLDRPPHGACTLFRKRVLLEIGGYSTDYTCQDNYYVWLKIINKHPVKNVNLPLFYYRRHGDNLTENQKRILDNRSEIKSDYVENNINEPEVLGIVPARGEKIDRYSPLLEPLGNKTVLEWTLDAVDSVTQITKIIVSTPDEKIKEFISNSNMGIEIHDRAEELARENVPLHKTLEEIISDIDVDQYDAIGQITPIAPFRPSRAIREAINTLEIFPVDFVVGVVPDNNKFFRHDGNGLQPITQTQYGSDLQLERERIFRRAGGIQILNMDFITDKEKWDDPKIGHVVLQQDEAIEIKQKNDLPSAREKLKDE